MTGSVSAEGLRREIEAARKDNVELGVPLLIFLAGHGGQEGSFQLWEDEVLRAGDLSGWLDELIRQKVQYRNLQSAQEAPPDEVVVVVDVCFSRRFLEVVSGPGRVVIGSSSDERASVIAGTSFAEAFFQWIARGGEAANLWRGFEEARAAVSGIFRQSPFIDVGGQGALRDDRGRLIAGREQGVDALRGMYVGGEIGGRALTLGIDPEIYRASARDVDGLQYVFEARGNPGQGGLKVFFAVLPEGGDLPGPDDPGTGEMVRVGAVGDTVIYRGEYRFEGDGRYTVMILGQDALGHYAGQRALQVVVKAGGPGDFNGDGVVDFEDFLLFAQHFGTRAGDSGWDARFDLDGDGVVGFSDFLIFGGLFGQLPVAKPVVEKIDR